MAIINQPNNQPNSQPINQQGSPSDAQSENNELEREFESSPAYEGSIQQILSENIGEYVMVEFLIGMSEIVTRNGILYSVGIDFIVLFDEENRQYEVCDLYAIQFVTFYRQLLSTPGTTPPGNNVYNSPINPNMSNRR